MKLRVKATFLSERRDTVSASHSAGVSDLVFGLQKNMNLWVLVCDDVYFDGVPAPKHTLLKLLHPAGMSGMFF